MMQNQKEVFVRFQDVQKSYDGETLIVKNLNLDVFRGEFLTFLGPSGSGKTTCLMMIAGFEPATHGEIILDNRPINNLPPHKRNIGMVFQNYALFPHMTVAENIGYPLTMRKVNRSEITRRVERVLEMVNLGGLGSRRPGELSGGQQQRVAVARALVFEPKLILMDEPLGALDKNLREQMQHEIRRIHQNLGVTVVYVTHDQSEALTMSNRVAVFDDGIIQQLAPPEELYDQPRNAFVAQFIGENNVFKGRVVSVNGKTCSVELNDGHQVEALAVNIAGVGSRSTVSLRPERVRIDPPAGATPNVFEAQIKELIYLGDHMRVMLSVCGHDDFVVKVQNADGHSAFTPGQAVSVGWNVENCRALDG